MSVFDGERFLRNAIESMLDQSLGDFEFIVIDDGSTDTQALSWRRTRGVILGFVSITRRTED